MMRYIFILLLIPILANGQISSTSFSDSPKQRSYFPFPIVKNEVDAFEGISKIEVARLEKWATTKPNGEGLSIDMALRSSGGIYFLSYYGIESCLVQGESKISLLLENKQVVDLGYLGDIDCSSTIRKADFVFANPEILDHNTSNAEILESQEQKVNQILSSPVDRIRIYASDGYSDYQTYDVLQNSSANKGILFYKIPYDHYVPMGDPYEGVKDYIKTYLELTLDGYDKNTELREYYDYYKGHTKYVLIDMIRVLRQNNR